MEYRPVCAFLMTVFTALIVIENYERSQNIPKRTLKFDICELRKLLNYSSKTNEASPQKDHPLDELYSLIDKQTENPEDDLKDNLKTLIGYLNEPGESIENKTGINMPQAEGIVTQFSSRPILKLNDKPECENLHSHWLSINSSAFEENSEQVSFDLLDSIQDYLPSETITADYKRLLHLTTSPPSRDRTTAKNCFRTRRVEVEPATGRPEKKSYVSRGRTFSRGDIFRNRPANTSRPPSLHVDDFLALETGYSKLASIRGTRGIRGSRSGISNRSTWYSKKYLRVKMDGTHYIGRSRGRSFRRP